MLKLKRHSGEKVIIDIPPSSETVRVEVEMLTHNRRSTEIGFTAPKDCLILRSELLDRVPEEPMISPCIGTSLGMV